MNKRLIGGVVFFLGLIIVISLVWDNRPNDQEGLRLPGSLGSYSEYGYYKIDPETILVSLKNGDANVFQPLLKDPNEIWEEIPDLSISWTQADFMRISSALSKLVWNESMDPKVWSIYDIYFSGWCTDNSCDLDSVQVVYFKTVRNSYATRFMDIHPYFGLVRWGDGASYPQPLLRKWKGVEFATSKIAAEEALRIAEANGGRERRLKATDGCYVSVNSSRFNPEYWHVMCVAGYQSNIDLDSGEVNIFDW